MDKLLARIEINKINASLSNMQHPFHDHEHNLD